MKCFYIYILKKIKKKFVWLIFKKDTYPEFSSDVINKFFKLSFSKTLGWNRKPLTSGIDVTNDGNAFFSINKHGERTTPSYDDKNGQISVYGDSFSFCRLVNNDETWPYYLSKIIE